MNEPLESLARLLKIPGELHLHETAGKWAYYGEAGTSRLADPNTFAAFEALLPELREHYGDALFLSLKHDRYTEFTLTAEPPDLRDLRKAIANGSTLTLDVKIDKTTVAAQRGLTDPSVATRLFFYAEALVSALSVPLIDLEEELFEDVLPGQKLILLVDSDDILLDGEWLAIVGGTFIPQWRNAIRNPQDEPAMLELAQRKVNWIDFDLHRLTPLHLMVTVKSAPAGDPILAALHDALFLCSVLYLARRSTWDAANQTWTCTFAADRQETDVRLAPPQKAGAAAADAMGEMVRWAYETDRADDRLIVVQQTVVDALQNNSAETNGTEIVHLAAELFLRAKRGWEAFIRGELKKYIEQVKALEETVAMTAKDYNEQVGALAATLIANVLAAVGVVLGSFLVAIFKSPFDANVFRFGTAVYVIYLMVFPIGIGLLATWQRFQRSTRTFAARKESFKQRIPGTQVDEITTSMLGESESWFRKWYAGSFVAYCVVVIVLAAAIVAVPPLIRCWNGNPDDFTLTSVELDRPIPGAVTLRGANFDRKKDIVVTAGRAVFTNAANPPTLAVYGDSALVFTPQQSELAPRTVTVRQGAIGPKAIKW